MKEEVKKVAMPMTLEEFLSREPHEITFEQQAIAVRAWIRTVCKDLEDGYFSEYAAKRLTEEIKCAIEILEKSLINDPEPEEGVDKK